MVHYILVGLPSKNEQPNKQLTDGINHTHLFHNFKCTSNNMRGGMATNDTQHEKRPSLERGIVEES